MKSEFWLSLLFATVSLSQAGSPVLSPVTVYTGMCDASAAVALDAECFAVANDEDNPIRIYRADQGGPPVASVDLSGFLNLNPKKPEVDLEAACWQGDYIFWISSHGRNREGKFRPNRHYLFATTCQKTARGYTLAPVGRPYHRLLVDLAREPRLAPFGLAAASRLPPKARGALNIEGLCATPDGRLLVGFRNPIPQGKALLVPLLNPREMIAGKLVRFGDPMLLDLGGLGIRDLGYWQGKYVVVAGPYDGRGKEKVYLWSGGKAPPEKLTGIDLKDFTAEAVIVYPDGRLPFQLLSDDGTRLINGVCCKQLPDPRQRCFRSLWLTPNSIQ